MPKKHFALVVLIVLLFADVASAEHRRFHLFKALNNGQDTTRPLARFDFRYQYKLLRKKLSKNTFIFRTDRPIPLNEAWEINTRLDIPCVLTNKNTQRTPAKEYRFGLGDVLAEALLTKKIGHEWGAAAGSRFIFPTATGETLGSGKYQLLPTVAVGRKLPGISDGSFFTLTTRYAFDYAGSHKRRSISTLEFGPSFNWMMPRHWFVTTYPSTDIQINLRDHGNFFLPFNAMIGKTIPNKAVFSVEFGFPMYYSGDSSDFYTFYDFKVEARIGIFY